MSTKHNLFYSKTSDDGLNKNCHGEFSLFSSFMTCNDEICTTCTYVVLMNIINNIYYCKIINPYQICNTVSRMYCLL